MIHKMEFIDPEVHIGRNTTVRLGEKWALKAAPDDIVEIYRTHYAIPLATGRVTDVAKKHFLDITMRELEMEHDPSCRNPDGLKKAMERAYGDKFDIHSTVTLITFRVFSQELKG